MYEKERVNERKIVFQLDLARGVQLIEKLQVLELIGEHGEFRHGKYLHCWI